MTAVRNELFHSVIVFIDCVLFPCHRFYRLRIIALHLDILGCQKGHIWTQPNERRYHDVTKLLMLLHEVLSVVLINRLTPFLTLFIVLPLRLKQFYGAFKKEVLAKSYIITRIIISVCLIWKVYLSEAWIIWYKISFRTHFYQINHASSWQIFHINQTLLTILYATFQESRWRNDEWRSWTCTKNQRLSGQWRWNCCWLCYNRHSIFSRIVIVFTLVIHILHYNSLLGLPYLP